jgi:hypothetical protein
LWLVSDTATGKPVCNALQVAQDYLAQQRSDLCDLIDDDAPDEKIKAQSRRVKHIAFTCTIFNAIRLSLERMHRLRVVNRTSANPVYLAVFGQCDAGLPVTRAPSR